MATALPRNSQGVVPRRHSRAAHYGHIETHSAFRRASRAEDRAGGVDVCRLAVGLVGLMATFGMPVAVLYWVSIKLLGPIGSRLLSLAG